VAYQFKVHKQREKTTGFTW